MTKTLIRIIAGELGVAGGGKCKNSHRLFIFRHKRGHLTLQVDCRCSEEQQLRQKAVASQF